MDIEKNIKILEKFKNNEMQRDKLERDNRCGGWKIGDIYKKLELDIAIEHILAERKEDKKKIEELEEKNKEILNSKIGIDLSYDDYIPKQKIKEKIKDLEYNSSLGFEETLGESYKIETKIKEAFVILIVFILGLFTGILANNLELKNKEKEIRECQVEIDSLKESIHLLEKEV